jgi:hypothetical protein
MFDDLPHIANSAWAVLQSARSFLNVTRDGKGTPISNTLYRKWECKRAEVRRRMTAAGYLSLRHQLFPTEKEQEAYDALRTLAEYVGKSPQAPFVASAPPPLPDEASTARLAEIVKALEEFLPPPDSSATLAEQTHPVTRAIALMLAIDKKGEPIPTVDELTKAVGCSRSKLYRDRHFVATRKALKDKNRANIARGSKTAEGIIEAGYDHNEE